MALKGMIGLVTVIVWLSVFLAGLTIDSQPYRDALLQGNIGLRALAITMVTFTVTNAAILCVLSGVVGALSHSLLFENGETGSRRPKIESEGAFTAILSGVLRSFVIFLVFISGVYIGASDAFGSTTQEQYARVVAITCLLSFVVSFKPAYFSQLLSRLTLPENADR
jgi:hypothetical protein